MSQKATGLHIPNLYSIYDTEYCPMFDYPFNHILRANIKVYDFSGSVYDISSFSFRQPIFIPSHPIAL